MGCVQGQAEKDRLSQATFSLFSVLFPFLSVRAVPANRISIDISIDTRTSGIYLLEVPRANCPEEDQPSCTGYMKSSKSGPMARR